MSEGGSACIFRQKGDLLWWPIIQS